MKRRLLLCDTDKAYVNALAAYFISQRMGLEITAYSSCEVFCLDTRTYDVALLAPSFLEKIRSKEVAGEHFGTIFCLAQDARENGGDYEVLYKFQQMQTFREKLLRHTTPAESENVPATWTGICSPARHELTVLFALAYAKKEAEEAAGERVLLLDLESNSVLPELLDNTAAKTLADYLYLLEASDDRAAPLADCFSYYEGLVYLSPVRYFQELGNVDEPRWERFFASVAAQGFARVVVLFDEGMRGADRLLSYLRTLLVVGREGDYFRKFDRSFLNWLNEHEGKPVVVPIFLPLSGANLADGSYRVDQLLQGNLSRYAGQARGQVRSAYA